ncbi:hypothetical protein VTI74DRAFT_2407 [Chaetomium olivicolor]
MPNLTTTTSLINPPTTNETVAPHNPQPREIQLQPLISDLLRTKYLIPDSVFLVESVERNILVPENSSKHRGRYHDRPLRLVRLLLGDGELCIQAFLKPEIHCFVDSGLVYEGCLVRVEKGSIGVWEGPGLTEERDEEERGVGTWGEVVDGGVGDPERLERERSRVRKEVERKREKGTGKGKQGGKVVYLVVGDLVTVGWSEEYLGILRREAWEKEMAREGEVHRADEGEKEKGPHQQPVEMGDIGQRKKVTGAELTDKSKDDDVEELMQQLMAEEALQFSASAQQFNSRAAVTHPNTTAAKPPSPNPPDEDYITDSDSAFETLEVSPQKATQRRIQIPTPGPIPNAVPDLRQQLQAAIITQNQVQNNPRPQHLPLALLKPPRPWQASDPSQPLKLTPLASIPCLPYRQNWMINVLAVVCSLGNVEPSHIGPSFIQRTARISDMSTVKQVHLTVYLDPEGFTPEVGSVVLLMGVKNHLFDGGSLRKYVSDRPRHGGSWWVRKPEVLGWCQEEVEALRAWGGGVKNVDGMGDGL